MKKKKKLPDPKFNPRQAMNVLKIMIQIDNNHWDESTGYIAGHKIGFAKDKELVITEVQKLLDMNLTEDEFIRRVAALDC